MPSFHILVKTRFSLPNSLTHTMLVISKQKLFLPSLIFMSKTRFSLPNSLTHTLTDMSITKIFVAKLHIHVVTRFSISCYIIEYFILPVKYYTSFHGEDKFEKKISLDKKILKKKINKFYCLLEGENVFYWMKNKS
mgnify:CR=1 FL=1